MERTTQIAGGNALSRVKRNVPKRRAIQRLRPTLVQAFSFEKEKIGDCSNFERAMTSGRSASVVESEMP